MALCLFPRKYQTSSSKNKPATRKTKSYGHMTSFYEFHTQWSSTDHSQSSTRTFSTGLNHRVLTNAGRPKQRLRPFRDLFLFDRKEKIESQPDRRHLFVRVLAGVVVVLIIRVEFHVFAHRKQSTRVERRGADFTVLTLVKHFGSDIRDE